MPKFNRGGTASSPNEADVKALSNTWVPEVDKFYERPWGGWKIVETDPYTKIITVAPGGMLSLQKHSKRSEIWTPLGPGLIMYTYEPCKRTTHGRVLQEEEWSAEVMEQGCFYTIHANVQHRLINPTAQVGKVIETISGEYDENDIVRLQDIYER